MISGVLKRQDIDSLEELFQLVRLGVSPTEAFTYAEHLEDIWDWKSLITPHLYMGGDAFAGISQPHHFRFYVSGGIAHVQYKMYSRDQTWAPEGGYICLQSLPASRSKPELAPIKPLNPCEIKALEDYILMKENHIARGQYVEKNRAAVFKTTWLIQYLSSFPHCERSGALRRPFWLDAITPTTNHTNNLIAPIMDNASTSAMHTHQQSEVGSSEATILAYLPQVQRNSYFGPVQMDPISTATHGRRRHRPSIRQHVATRPLANSHALNI